MKFNTGKKQDIKGVIPVQIYRKKVNEAAETGSE